MSVKAKIDKMVRVDDIFRAMECPNPAICVPASFSWACLVGLPLRKVAKAFLLCIFVLIFSLGFAVRPVFGEAEEVDESKKEPSVQWKSLIGESLFTLVLQNGFRLATEEKTRAELKGPFLRDYFASAGNLHGWSDGGGVKANFIAHPFQGAVTGFIWVQNDPKYRRTEFGMNSMYWKSRLRATAFSWVYSTLFEIGPISEASLGNVQQEYPEVGFVDHVWTPVLGLGWMMAEDSIDKYIVKRIEGHTRNRFARAMARSLLNPARSYANVVAFKRPWERYTRPGVNEYDPNLWSIASTRKSPSGSDVSGSKSFLPSSHSGKQGREGISTGFRAFEFSAYYAYSQYSHRGINSGGCSGGGATGVIPINRWLGAVADVSGCKIAIDIPNISGDSLTYLFGPRFSYHPRDRWNIYLDLLVGGNAINLDRIYPLSHFLDTPDEWLNLPLYHHYKEIARAAEANVFASAIGGGVDLKIKRGLAIRLGNVQYVRTNLREFMQGNYSGGIRFTTGLVLRPGEL